MTTTTRTHAGAANERLTKALVNAAARGLRPRCGDWETSYLWLSDAEHERQQAASLCPGCVVISECDQVGRHQRFGVWGAKDRTRAPGRKKPA